MRKTYLIHIYLATNHPAFCLIIKQKHPISHHKIAKSRFIVLTCDAPCLYRHTAFSGKNLTHFFIGRLVGMLPTQPSVTVCRRGKHATKRGTSFAAHLPCFIGLLNVLCRIVAYVRTGHVTEIISRVSQQFVRTKRARRSIYAHVSYC